GGTQDLGKAAERMLTDDFPIVGDLEPFAVTFRGIDVEMVGPELDHDLVELTLRKNGSDQGGAHEFLLEQIVLVLEKFAQRLTQSFKTSHGIFNFFIIDLFGIQLLIDVSGGGGVEVPFGKLADLLVISGAGTKGSAIQSMNNGVNRFRRRSGER